MISKIVVILSILTITFLTLKRKKIILIVLLFVRLLLLCLMNETGVSAEKDRKVIDIVSKYMFNHNFNNCPSTQCATNNKYTS